jgi:xylan 1,4-beta-xylosidase
VRSRIFATATAAAVLAIFAMRVVSQERSAETIAIKVDANRAVGPMKPIWAWFGYDEPNYTYMKDGQKLLTELSKLSPVPVFVRTHNLLTTGDGTPALKWGSTNAYTEDANGRPIYDWTIVDRIVDTYRARGMKPLMQIGFMPEALSVKPQPYKHDWQPGLPYGRIYTGWAHPPKDYDKWRELIYQWVKHSVEKYGRAEVESWWWEVWNEPDIAYWQGTPEEYMKMYDYAADGLKRALPTLEYIGFHAKGAPRVMKEADPPYVRMSVSNQLRAIANGFSIVASFPELKNTPIVIGESDPEGCAACPMKTDPHNAYRNGTMYSSYTAEQIARTYELADLHGVNLMGAVTWAFEFEDQPYFYGFRDLSTNGLAKPVLNVFRMLGQMGGDRVQVHSSGALALAAVRDTGVREKPDVAALASRQDRSIAVLVWNYHDDDKPAPDAPIDLTIAGVPGSRVRVTHHRVDHVLSNSYEAWKKMGSPQPPSARQYGELEKISRLQELEPPRQAAVKGGVVSLSFALPRQGVSLVKLSW